MRQNPNHVESKNLPHHVLHFLLSAVLTITLVCAMTLYYGFRELEKTGQDIAVSVLKDFKLQRILGNPPSRVARGALDVFHDASQIEVCMAGRCVTQRAPEGTHMGADLLNSTGLPCTTVSEPDGRESVRACMALDGVAENVSRNIIILLMAQGIGLGVWSVVRRRAGAHRSGWLRWAR